MISVQDGRPVDQLGELAGFRQEFYSCLTARADALFELADAVLCADGPVTSVVELSLAVEHRRGHGALYDGVNQGRVDIGRFRKVVASRQIPRCDNGRIVLAIDVSNWLRPDAATSPDRLFCHTYGRGKGTSADDPRLAVLVCRGAGAGRYVVDGDSRAPSGWVPTTRTPTSPQPNCARS